MFDNSKFFGSNGTKAAPQQSKLSFASKTKPTEDEDVKAEVNGKPAPGPIAHLMKEESKTTEGLVLEKEEDGDIKMTNKEEEVLLSPKVKTEPVSQKEEDTISSPLKRQASEDDEDDEPPTKKARTKTPMKKSSLSKVESVNDTEKPKKELKKSRQSVGFDKDVKDNEETTSKIDRKPTPKKGKKTVVEEDDEAEASIPSKAAPVVVKKDTVIKEEDAESSPESEQEREAEESDEEEEKPEIAAKARAKVQTTLGGKTKDPYPDWKAGDPVPYAALCTTFSKIEMTTKRLEIQAHCALFLRQVLRLTPNDLLPTVLLMVNKLAAEYTGIELGIGESLIMKAIGESTGRSLAVIKTDQKEIGDLGLVAAKSRSNQPTMFKPKPLTVRGVHEGLMAVAVIEGKGAQDRKVGGIKKLLSAADADKIGKGSIDITKDKGGPSEAKYLIRTLEGKMRLGLAEKTVLVSLAQAMVAHEAGVKDKVPSTEQLAKGEAVLKSVFK